jgi:hypothetical protein
MFDARLTVRAILVERETMIGCNRITGSFEATSEQVPSEAGKSGKVAAGGSFGICRPKTIPVRA